MGQKLIKSISQVTGMPAFDIPNQVKVHKSENVGDRIKNIPCPFGKYQTQEFHSIMSIHFR